MKTLDSYWYESSPLNRFVVVVLLPLSALYCLFGYLRRKLYSLNVIKSFRSDVPVIIVGNIVAGGSGKTPLLIALCEYARNRGLSPGVVSRGYGGRVDGLKQVVADDMAELVGDEPLMIHRKIDVPVVVSADRVSAVNHLLENNGCDVVFSDDGLQHYRMMRDFEIAVVDTSRYFGNGFCLPAGPLREPVSRLNDVDLVIYNTGSDTTSESKVSESCSYSLRLSGISRLRDGEKASFSSFEQRTVHAVAGIGNPARFFNQLRQQGMNIIEHIFSDHHRYEQGDFSGWASGCIVMTEKDAVKCHSLVLLDAWVVAAKVELSAKLESELDSRLLPVIDKKMRDEKET
ncbi:MAG TPA: tetraacyldisaccharide 4'-kinase [Gammaproteobacteria bacterium]|nr:tetraacyldisaccharide 4'-kinase [Gammaproteobacteria bacterium]